MTVESQKNE